MSRVLKILLAAIAVIVVLMVGIAVAVMLLFDPNEYRGEIAELVEAKTGRTFAIDGEIGLRVFPCCAVAVDDTRLGNPPGFEQPDFASVRSVRLGLQLMPLLFGGHVVVDEVSLDGLQVRLLRRADGSANWEFEAVQGVGAAEDVPAAGDEAGGAPPELSVAGVSITDALVEFRDDTAGSHLVVEDLDVRTGPVAVGQPITVDVALDARDVPSQASIEAAFEAGLVLAEDLSTAELTGIESTSQITAPDLPGGTVSTSLQAALIRTDLATGVAQLESVVSTVTVAGVRIETTAAGTAGGGRTALRGTLAVPEFSPRDLRASLGQPPLETSDPTVLAALDVQADWALTDERIDVTDMNLRLDDTRVTGKLGSHYANESSTTFDVDVDAIDLDRYATPAQESAAEANGGASDDAEIPADALRDLDLDGRFAIGQLTMGGLSLQNVLAKMTAKNGVVRIDPSSADVYGGRYEGSLAIDVRGEVPQLSFAQTLDAVQAGGMLNDLYDAENLQGLLQARMEGSGSGHTTTELKRGMQGSVSLDLDDAIYKGADVWYEIRKAVARIKGKPGPEAPADPQTEITALGFAGQLSDGVLRSNRLIAEIPFIRVEGGGTMDLLQNQVDYRLNARMLSRPNFPDADDLADLEKITIPIILKGDAAAPTVAIDLEELAKDAAVQKGKDRLLKKLGLDEPEATGDAESNATDQQRDSRDEARDLLKKGLRDLFDP